MSIETLHTVLIHGGIVIISLVGLAIFGYQVYCNYQTKQRNKGIDE